MKDQNMYSKGEFDRKMVESTVSNKSKLRSAERLLLFKENNRQSNKNRSNCKTELRNAALLSSRPL